MGLHIGARAPSVLRCAQYCGRYKYFGLLNSGECSCGNDFGNMGDKLEDTACSRPCANGCGRCGAPGVNAIYRSGSYPFMCNYLIRSSTGLQWRLEKNHRSIDYNATVAYRAHLQTRMTYDRRCDVEYRDAGHMIPNWMGDVQRYILCICFPYC